MEEIGFVENIERKRRKSEAIPSLLLVNDDVISPITVLFDTTKLIVTGENKTSPQDVLLTSNPQTTDRQPLPLSKSSSKDENSQRNTSEENKIFLQSTLTNNKEGCRSLGQEIQADINDNSGSNVGGLTVDRKTQRRRSDCPHQSQGLDEGFSDGPTLGSRRMKAKSIERAPDLDKESHEPRARGIVLL